MNLQQGFIRIKRIKQDNFLLDGTYTSQRYLSWKTFNADCHAIQSALNSQLADFGPNKAAPTICETTTIATISRDIFEHTSRKIDENVILARAAYMSDEKLLRIYDRLYNSMEASGKKDAESIENTVFKIVVHQITPSDLNQLAKLAELNADDAEAVINEQDNIDNTEYFIDQLLSHGAEQYGGIEAANVYLNLIENKPDLALPTGSHASYNIWRIKQLEQMTKLFAEVRKMEILQRLQHLKNIIQKAGEEDSIVKTVPADVVRAIDHCRKDVFREMIAHRLVREIHTLFSSRQPAQVGAILSDIKLTALLKAQEETGHSTPE